MPSIFYFLWLLPVPVLTSIGVVMYRRKQHSIYPVFWAYVCYQAFRVAVCASLFKVSVRAYFYAYWIGVLLSIVFSLALLRDIFLTVLRNYPSLTKLRAVGYELMLALVWTAGLLIAFYKSELHTYKHMIDFTGEAVSFTAVGMFVLVVVSSAILGIKWTEKVCGIASALGLLGTVDLIVYTALSRRHLTNGQAGWIETIAYDVAVAILAFYFLPNRADKIGPTGIRSEVMDWTESIRGAVSR